jgi:ribosomal protein S18 acetylase RimI-like enzyme
VEYAGPEAAGYGAWIDGRLVGICWYWWGERYSTRQTWPLAEGTAKLVQISTDGAYRGRGIASALVAYSASEMMRLGFQPLFARIWHSNRASIRVFEKASWKYVAFVVRLAFTERRNLRIILKWNPQLSIGVRIKGLKGQ